MIRILKPVPIRERKPLKTARYVIEFFSGLIQVKTWRGWDQRFKTLDPDGIKHWYKFIELPSVEDMEYIVGDAVPPGAHEREKELMIKGARIAMQNLLDIIEKA